MKPSGGTTETIPLPLLGQNLDRRGVSRSRRRPRRWSPRSSNRRNAALLYIALLSLDDDSRAWIADQPSLISEIVADGPRRF